MKNTPDTRIRILEAAVPLFAQAGYDGVSMRAIAGAAGIQAPSLYNHFPDKQGLYLEAVAHAFADKARVIGDTTAAAGTPEQRLREFIERFTRMIAEDPDFRRLLQREFLDGDEARLKQVAEQVFLEPFSAVTRLARELAPDCDPYMVAISMAGLINYHFESAPVRRFLPGVRDEHEDPAYVARHITRLLLQGLRPDRNPEP